MPLSFDCALCGYHDRVFADCISDDEQDMQCVQCSEWGCGNCIEDDLCEECREANALEDAEDEAAPEEVK